MTDEEEKYCAECDAIDKASSVWARNVVLGIIFGFMAICYGITFLL